MDLKGVSVSNLPPLFFDKKSNLEKQKPKKNHPKTILISYTEFMSALA